MRKLHGVEASAYAPVTLENLQALVADMGLSPNDWVSCARLYDWYAGMCAEEGLQPLNQNAFGRGVTALGFRAKTRREDGKLVRSRLITGRAFPERYAPVSVDA